MAAEDDDLEMLKMLLRQRVNQAQSLDDLGRKLISDLSLAYDDYVVESNLADTKTIPTGPIPVRALSSLRRQWSRLRYAMKYGTSQSSNPSVEALVTGLEQRKRISSGQRRVLNIYQMIQIHRNGRCEILAAPKQSYRAAKYYFALAATLSVVFLYLSVEVLSPLLIGLPCSYTLGAILGWLWRDAYDHAWGRDKLAQKLKQLLPWMTLRLQQ